MHGHRFDKIKFEVLHFLHYCRGDHWSSGGKFFCIRRNAMRIRSILLHGRAMPAPTCSVGRFLLKSSFSNSMRRAEASDRSSDAQRCYLTNAVHNELSAATRRQIQVCRIPYAERIKATESGDTQWPYWPTGHSATKLSAATRRLANGLMSY